MFIPGDVEVRRIDEVGIDDPHVRYLITIAGTDAVGGSRGKNICPVSVGSGEGSESINQVKVIVNIPAINTVSIIGLIVNANDVFSPVLRPARLKKRIIRLDRVREGGSHLRHSGIDRGNGCAIGGDALR